MNWMMGKRIAANQLSKCFAIVHRFSGSQLQNFNNEPPPENSSGTYVIHMCLIYQQIPRASYNNFWISGFCLKWLIGVLLLPPFVLR